jgi:hypothetical protein
MTMERAWERSWAGIRGARRRRAKRRRIGPMIHPGRSDRLSAIG